MRIRYHRGMPTIVRHNPTGEHYILLGAGHAQWATARPNRLLGDLFAAEQRGESKLVCLCDQQGKVEWAYADRITIVSVDDQSPEKHLASFPDQSPTDQ